MASLTPSPPTRCPPPIPPQTPPPRRNTAGVLSGTSAAAYHTLESETPVPHARSVSSSATTDVATSPSVAELVRGLRLRCASSIVGSLKPDLAPAALPLKASVHDNSAPHTPPSTQPCAFPVPRTPIPSKAVLHHGRGSASQPTPQSITSAAVLQAAPAFNPAPNSSLSQASLLFVGKPLPLAPAPTDPLLRIITFYARLKHSVEASSALAACKQLRPLLQILHIVIKQAARLATKAGAILTSVDEWKSVQERRSFLVRERQKRGVMGRACTWSEGVGPNTSEGIQSHGVYPQRFDSRTAKIAAECETAKYRQVSNELQHRRQQDKKQHPLCCRSTPTSSDVPSERTAPAFSSLDNSHVDFNNVSSFTPEIPAEHGPYDGCNPSWGLLDPDKLGRVREEDAAVNAYIEKETREILELDAIGAVHQGLMTLVNAAGEYVELLDAKRRQRMKRGQVQVKEEVKGLCPRKGWERSFTL
jgi:hypothetical protein